MIYHQNTPDWEEMRNNKIGASDAPVIMGTNPYKSLQKLWREKMGLEKPFINSAMQKGNEREKIAREHYEWRSGNKWMEPAVVFHKEHDFMVASLDGVNPEWTCGVEIKCPSSESSWNRLKEGYEQNKVIDLYYPQVQHQLACSGLKCVFFYVFYVIDDTFGELEFEDFIIPVEPNEDYIAEMIAKEKDFYEYMQGIEPPPRKPRSTNARKPNQH